MDLPESLTAHDNYSYRERELRAPSISEGEVVIFDEPGRVLNRSNPTVRSGGVDCRSHYYRVTKPEFGPYTLRVRHGAGEESCSLSHSKRIIDALLILDSDSRYWLLHKIMDVKRDAEIQTTERVTNYWRQAAAEKRIKTRKVRDGVKVSVVS